MLKKKTKRDFKYDLKIYSDESGKSKFLVMICSSLR